MKNWLLIIAVAGFTLGAIQAVCLAKEENQQLPAAVSNYMKERQFRLGRGMPEAARACIECHQNQHPGIFADWAASGHAQSGITCLDCHLADPSDQDISTVHDQVYESGESPWASQDYYVPVAAAVTPKDCSRCHPDEAQEYARSKHANTVEIMWKIDPWLNDGMNSSSERKAGCFACHGTVLKMKDGTLDPETWPNVGVG
ncbi:MAG: hydroxylamine oxidoreductase, partial [Bacteroidetes bacterium]|nr:hydroxylamine oxidoreductase [Bacteroidota bacterium]